MVRWNRRWAAISAAAVAVAGLVGFAHTAADSPSTAGAEREAITYELTGPREVTDLWYGDIADIGYSPHAVTVVERATLPWRLTVPGAGAPSLRDLSARSAEPVAITCTVRRGEAVLSTQTAVGWVGCDTTPASGRSG